MIRTMKEIHDGQVTVTMTVDTSPSQRLYTSEEMAWAQQTEAELVTQPLRCRIEELEVQHRVDEDGLRRKIRELAAQVAELKAERQRLYTGDQVAEELGVAVGTLKVREDQVALLQGQVQTMASQLARVSGSVLSPEVIDALDNVERSIVSRWYVVASAVRQVRHIMRPDTD